MENEFLGRSIWLMPLTDRVNNDQLVLPVQLVTVLFAIKGEDGLCSLVAAVFWPGLGSCCNPSPCSPGPSQPYCKAPPAVLDPLPPHSAGHLLHRGGPRQAQCVPLSSPPHLVAQQTFCGTAVKLLQLLHWHLSAWLTSAAWQRSSAWTLQKGAVNFALRCRLC